MTIVIKLCGMYLILTIATVASFADESAVIAFKDPPVCSSFEKLSQPSEYSCAITSNGNDDKGNERKKVSIKLKAQTKEISIGGHLIKTENYGTYLPPVVEARAGDTVAVTLTNELEPFIASGHAHHCEADKDHLAPPPGSNPTNLHYFHGGIVPPNNGNSDGLGIPPNDHHGGPPNSARWGTGDNIYSCLERGQEHTFEVPIPGYKELNAAVLEEKGKMIAHPPGLNWYHSHLHGISSNQVLGGMAGLLSVGRRYENIRAKCDAPGSKECEEKTATVRKNTLVKYALLRDISVKKESGNWVPDPEGQNFGSGRVCGVLREDGVTFDTDNEGLRKGFCQPSKKGNEKQVAPDKLWLFTINGQKYPTIEVDESKTGILLRLGNLSPNFAYWLELYDEDASDPADGKFVPKKITILSVDGVVPAKPQSAKEDSELISVESYRVPDLLLMPASRVEIYIDRRDIIDPTKDTTFVLRTKKLDAGGDVWPEIQLARITFKAVEEKEEPVQLALNATIAETVAIEEFFVPFSDGVRREPPPGCMRDLREGEYRQVRFDEKIIFDDGPKQWKIVTALLKNGTVQKDDDGEDAKIDEHFNAFVNPDHSINWSGNRPAPQKTLKHTCIELKEESEQKPQLWELHNNTAALHNFHIHQMKFRLAKLDELKEYGIVTQNGTVPPSSTCDGVADCDQPDYKFYEPGALENTSVSNLGRAEFDDTDTITSIIEWHDTIPMPPVDSKGQGGKVYVMMSFADKVQAGRFVYHCHILKHEDNGLMAPIEVWDPSVPAN